MPSRIAYLSTSNFSANDLRMVSDKLCAKEFSEQISWGFIDVRNKGNTIAATFVERFETEEQVADPFGHITTYKRIQYSQLKFRLCIYAPQLEVYDAPRSISPLVTELSKCFPIPVSFSRIQLDLNLFVKLLKRQTSVLIMQGATLQDIGLATDVLVKVALVGNREITPFLKIASLGKKVILNKVCLLVQNKNGSFKIEATIDGRIQIISNYDDDLILTIREMLEGCISYPHSHG